MDTAHDDDKVVIEDITPVLNEEDAAMATYIDDTIRSFVAELENKVLEMGYNLKIKMDVAFEKKDT